MKTLPKYLYRNDDGRRITLYKDGLYHFYSKGWGKSPGYSYEFLVNKCEFKESLKDCEIKPPVVYKRSGCGDDDD